MEATSWPLLTHPGSALFGLLLGFPVGSWLADASHRLAYDDESFDPRKGPRQVMYYRHSDFEDLSGLPRLQQIPFFGLLIGMVEFCNYGVLGRPAACDDCGHILSRSDRVPVFAYLRLGGRCGACSSPIPRQHFWVEFVTPFVLALVFACFGFTLEAFLVAIVALLGLLASVVDWNFQIIPDEVPTTALAVGLGVGLGHTLWAFQGGIPHLSPLEIWNLDAMSAPWHLGWALSGAAVGGLALWGLQVIGARLAGTQAMGSGDIKLVVALGTFLGPKGAGIGLFYASMLGAVAGLVIRIAGGGRREEGFTKFAFGPYLCLGFLLVLILGADQAFALYLDTVQAIFGGPGMEVMIE